MDEELRKTLEVTAVSSNRFYVQPVVVRDADGHVLASSLRLAFGEALDGEIFYRIAAMITETDAVALRDRLIEFYPLKSTAN